MRHPIGLHTVNSDMSTPRLVGFIWVLFHYSYKCNLHVIILISCYTTCFLVSLLPNNLYLMHTMYLIIQIHSVGIFDYWNYRNMTKVFKMNVYWIPNDRFIMGLNINLYNRYCLTFVIHWRLHFFLCNEQRNWTNRTY